MRKTLARLLAVFLFALLLVEVGAAGQTAYRLSERTYRQLSSVHELMQKRRYDEALAGLDTMIAPVVSLLVMVPISLMTQKSHPPKHDMVDFIPDDADVLAGKY